MTRADAIRRTRAKFPGREVVAKRSYLGGQGSYSLGLRVPVPSALSSQGLATYMIVGKGSTWARAVADMETRLVYSTRGLQ